MFAAGYFVFLVWSAWWLVVVPQILERDGMRANLIIGMVRVILNGGLMAYTSWRLWVYRSQLRGLLTGRATTYTFAAAHNSAFRAMCICAIAVFLGMFVRAGLDAIEF
jgi:hypothetical protein